MFIKVGNAEVHEIFFFSELLTSTRNRVRHQLLLQIIILHCLVERLSVREHRHLVTLICKSPNTNKIDGGYPHDGRADKDSYPHDRHVDSHCLHFIH